MPKNFETVECPHCGRTLRVVGSASRQHIGACLRDPAVFAATRQDLDNGDGTIKTRKEYLRTKTDGISYDAIVKQLGDYAWEGVAEFFGLEYVEAKKGPKTRKERQHHSRKHAVRFFADMQAEQAEPVTVCGLPVSRVVDYGNRIGYVLR